MAKLSFKGYLEEYYKYFDSFSEVIDHHDKDDDEYENEHKSRKEDDDFASDGEEVRTKTKTKKHHRIKRGPYHRDKEDLNPRRFRQWMELSIAGD